MDDFINISPRRQAALNNERLDRTYAVLSHCNHSLARSNEEKDLLSSFCGHLVEQGGYEFAYIGYATPRRGCKVRLVAQAGKKQLAFPSIALKGANAEHHPSPCRAAIQSGRPVLLRKIADEAKRAPWADAALRCGYRSMIALPLKMDHETFGNFSIYAAETDAFGDREVDLLEQLAGDLAFGIESTRERTRRVRLLRETVEKEERERIAAALHDVVGQTMLSVNLGLKRMRAMLAGDAQGDPEEMLDGVIVQTATAIQELRDISGELRPLFLERLSLVEAIRYHCEELAGRAGIAIRLAPGDDNFTVEPRVKEQCFLGFREALGNAVKYAKTGCIEVDLRSATRRRLTVTITDDGVGFDLRALNRHSGLGLCMIRERAESVGGSAEIRSGLGQGTRVDITVPIIARGVGRV